LIIEPIDGKNRLIELLKKLSPIEEELYEGEDAPSGRSAFTLWAAPVRG